MLYAVISHCPNCPALQTYLAEVIAMLERQEVSVTLEDGNRGEFKVLVNGKPVVADTVAALPAVEAVGRAVRQERVVGRYARPHTWI